MNIKFTPERALIMDDIAIVADIHLGLENVLLESGVSIPRVQIDEIIERIDTIIDKYRVKKIVIAGDLKHEFGRNLPFEWEDVETLLKYLIDNNIEVVIIRGNHDNYLKAILARFGLELFDEIEIRGWKVVHGHKDCNADKIIMGHEHPAVKIRIDGVYTFHCFLKVVGSREVIVLPAFSPLVSGSDVTSCNFISPLLKNVGCDDVEVYAVNDDVYYLGTLSDLRSVMHENL